MKNSEKLYKILIQYVFFNEFSTKLMILTFKVLQNAQLKKCFITKKKDKEKKERQRKKRKTKKKKKDKEKKRKTKKKKKDKKNYHKESVAKTNSTWNFRFDCFWRITDKLKTKLRREIVSCFCAHSVFV